MTNVWDVYFWNGDRLLYVADKIVGQTRREAERRAVAALRSRPALQDDERLLSLMKHYNCGAEKPDGISVVAQHLAGSPR